MVAGMKELALSLALALVPKQKPDRWRQPLGPRSRFRLEPLFKPLRCLMALLAGCAIGGAPASAYELLTREAWRAVAPVRAMRPQTPARLTVHHSGVFSPPQVDLVKKMQGLQRYSQAEGRQADGKPKPVWADVPYHFVIGPDGRVAEGRPVGFAGDTNTEYDPMGHLLITLLGNFEEQEPTAVQIAVLDDLLVELSARYDLDPQSITGHRDQAATACPGKHLQALLPGIRQRVAARLARP